VGLQRKGVEVGLEEVELRRGRGVNKSYLLGSEYYIPAPKQLIPWNSKAFPYTSSGDNQ